MSKKPSYDLVLQLKNLKQKHSREAYIRKLAKMGVVMRDKNDQN